MFEWCKNLETHLINVEWETIPTEAVKRMLWSCITGSARKKIVLFHPTGLAFKNYETGYFFTEIVKRFIQKNTRKARNRKRWNIPEDIMLTRSGNARNRNTWTGNRKVAKIPKNIIPTRKGYGYKHMLQARGAWLTSRMK